MSDWQVGDLAVRVDGDPINGIAGSPPRGLILPIDGLYVSTSGVMGLLFNAFPGRFPSRGWHSAYFRKIRPDKQKACETEFVTLLKRSKQRVTTPVSHLIDKLIEDQERRYAWLFGAGEQIREWREEDRRAGILWSDEHGN